MEYAERGRLKPIQEHGFKSKLEYIAYLWLTKICNLTVQYEPFTFKTSVGNYTPDFFCKETNQYFECKPFHNTGAWDLYKHFSIEKKRIDKKDNDFFIITPEGMGGFENCFGGFTNGFTTIYSPNDNYVYYCCCSHCQKISFHTGEGNYRCRHCGEHEGDHDQQSFDKKVRYLYPDENPKPKEIMSFEKYYLIFYNGAI